MNRNKGTIWGALALALTIGSGVAAAANTESPCADMNNNGVCDAGDVTLGREISNDGYFSTARSEGNYRATDGKVGIVVPGSVKGRNGVVYLVASGDIFVKNGIQTPGEDSAVVLVSTGGSIRIADGARITGGMFVKLSAAGDLEAGDKCLFRARSKNFGGQLYLLSQGGSVKLGERTVVNGGGLTQIATNNDVGGGVTIGAGSRITSNRASVSVTAGDKLDMRNTSVSGDAVLLGSYATDGGRDAGGPGHAMVRNCSVEGETAVRVFADGGRGSTVDVTGTEFATPASADVMLEADVIVR